MADELTGEVTELLQQLIRNACVNDGSPGSGEEVRNADLLEDYLEGSGVELETYESLPGRRSIVARLEGSDPSAPTLCLMGHTDVVPVSLDGWSRDPFGGELVNGEIWGRGAVDMLNLTASMSVALRTLVRRGFRPKGTVVFLGVADEEAGGHLGAEWLLEHHPDAVSADYVVTEWGGLVFDAPSGTKVTVSVAEKGVMWRKLRVRGTPGHGSAPYGTDNALVKAAEIVRRLADYRPNPVIDDLWRAFVAAQDLPPDLAADLVDPERIWSAFERADPGLARVGHACTHTTFSPNVIEGGVKTNVIPDLVELEVDVRSLPGETDDDVHEHLHRALGDLAHEVEIEPLQSGVASRSPTETPLWDALQRAAAAVYPEATLLPSLMLGATDARFYRERGAIAYGFGLFSRGISFAEFRSRFHGNDERVDLESLRLSTELWVNLLRDLQG